MVPQTAPTTLRTSHTRTLRIGSVGYLNAKPLVYGLESAADVRLSFDVPSKLLDGLRAGRYDVSLLPVIDYQRLDDLVIIPAGGIGCDGPTLTVRIFSRVPIERIKTLACDPDSHTSVALARIVLAKHYDLRPEFIGLRRRAAHPRDEAQLLIGDKVVCEEPVGYDHQIDLGAAWKAMTGLPFVFATWMARRGVDAARLSERLTQARTAGLEHIGDIIESEAIPRGWPALLARQYLTENLKYDMGEAQLTAIRQFHSLAAEHGIIPAPPRPLTILGGRANANPIVIATSASS
jgi:chorismate dehydratase